MVVWVVGLVVYWYLFYYIVFFYLIYFWDIMKVFYDKLVKRVN